LIPWSRGKPLAWDVTVPDTFAASHVNRTSETSAAAAQTAANNKKTKYRDILSTHLFVPVAIETGGAWCTEAIEFIQELGRRITETTGDPLETSHLFQRISICLQRGNALSFLGSFESNSMNILPAAS
jgi:hypothetical protein